MAVTLVAPALLSSCTSFTKTEKSLIGTDPESGIMTVVKTTDRADSLFLRTKSTDLTHRDLKSPYYQILKARMLATVQNPEEEGVGIAAPQVGVHRRVIAVQRFDKEGEPFEIYPNAYIQYYSPRNQPSVEGCLSIPDTRSARLRSNEITIYYTDEETGKIVTEIVRGFTAIIFQHEIDHLEGLLCTDSARILGPDTPTETRLRAMGLTDISEAAPTVAVRLVYATPDNFMGRVMYNDINKAFATPQAARALHQAQQTLRHLDQGLSLVVYDAARPVSVQRSMWNAVAGTSKAGYVANPAKGGLHNYGVAVDVSIVDRSGNPLDMGTEFDHLGELARIDIEEKLLDEGRISQQAYNNRRLLRKVMTEAGFHTIPNEWWHFNYVTIEQAKKELKLINF